MCTMTTFEPIEITPGFYQLGTPFFPVYLSLGDDAMLLEGGNSGTFDLIVSQIKMLGVDPERIKYLALTHVHADHVGALPRFKAIWPHIRVIVGDKAPKALSTEKLVRQFISMDQSIADIMYEKGEIPSLPEKHDQFSLPLDEFVVENDRIDLGGGIGWTAYTVPGHSPGHIAWREEREEILVIGDTTGFYVPDQDTFWPNYFFSLVEYTKSIRKLSAMAAKWIALGHNGVIKGSGKDFFQKALSVTESYHQEMMSRISNGEDPDAVAREKAEWVFSISDHMPAKATQPLCKLLIKISQKESVHPELSFKLDPSNMRRFAENSEFKEQDVYSLKTFSEVIRHNAAHHPEEDAFVIGSQRVTFSDFDKRVNRLANALGAIGCEKGDCIGVMSTNCIEYLVVYGAAMKGGCILVHLSPRIPKKELEDIVSGTNLKALFCKLEFSETARAFQKQVEGLKHCVVFDEEFPVLGYQRFVEGHSEDEVEADLKADDPLTILFSRGTTGFSKGALYTHQQKYANSVNRAIELDVQFGDKNLVVLPISHIAGESHLWPFFINGGTNVFPEEIVFNPLGMLKTIEKEKITDVFIFSPQLVALLKTPNIGRYDLKSLKRIWYSGIPVPLDILERGMKMLGPIFFQGYGTTEAGPDITLLSSEDHVQAFEQIPKRGILASFGKPSLGVEVRIVDETDRELPPWEKGEIIARSNHLMSGYWGRREETVRVMKNGWFYTGDTGFKDEDGYVYLADRKEDLINIGGESVSSKDVEDVLKHYFAVSDAAVVGVPDSDGAEHILGVVVLLDSVQEVTAEEIINFCAGRIERHKIPERLEFVTMLPKSSQGIILKRELRKRYPVWGADRR